MSKRYFEKLNADKLTEIKEEQLSKAKKHKFSVVGDAENTAKLVAKTNNDASEHYKKLTQFNSEAKSFMATWEKLDDDSNAFHQFLSDAISFTDEDINALQDAAEALGLKADDITVYKELAKLHEEARDLLKDIVDETKTIGNLIEK